MILNFDQIKALALGASFNDYQATIAAAVAMAESGGQTDVVGDLNLPNAGPSYGLWQINSVHAGAEKAVDPQIGAHMAFQVSNGGTNWRPWTTYRTGAYRKFLPVGFNESTGDHTRPGSAVPGPGAPPTGAVVTTAAGLTGALAIAVQWFMHWPISAPGAEQSAAIATLLLAGGGGLWHWLITTKK